MKINFWRYFCYLLGAVILFLSLQKHAFGLDLSTLKINGDYKIEIYADVPDARSLSVAGGLKAIFVGTRGDSLYAIHERQVILLADNLHVPNGVAWQAPYLYLAEQDKISRFKITAKNLKNKNLPPAELLIKLPNYRHHGWRVLHISNDGWLYVSLGAPCNVCSAQGLHATISRLKIAPKMKKPTKLEIVARGVRNTVGLDINPSDGKLYFTDNGVDNMGDDVPLEELNRLDKIGQHFGFPYYGGGDARTRRKLPKEKIEFTAPIATFPAHNAPLGVHFYRGNSAQSAFMPDFQGKALIALHGSWNRSVPDGYRVDLVDLSSDSATVSTVIDGFLDLTPYRGRPVDIATLWDGSILISDDNLEKVYRLSNRDF